MSKFVANSNKSYVSTIHVNQDAGENDWISYQITEQSKSPLQILSGTTASVLKTHRYLFDPTGNGGLVAFYPLDGNTNDLVGGYNGVVNGTVSLTDMGVFGNCASVSGHDYNNYISIPTINLGNNFTISLWVYLNSYSSEATVFLGNEKYISFGSLGSNYSDVGKLTFALGDGSNWESALTGETPLQLNTWYHCIVVINSGAAQLYLNSNTNSGAQTYSNSFNNLFYLFRRKNMTDNAYTLDGKLDQLRIYNRALTQEEISKLYHEDIQIIKEKETILLWNSTDNTKTLEVNSITDNGDETYDIDISSAGLTQPPTDAHIITTVQDLPVGASTTSTSLIVHQFPEEEPPRKNAKLIVFNSNDGLKDKVLSSYNKQYVNLVNNVDPFGDGSGVALYEFEGNANDTGGNHTSTINGSPVYNTGVFGQCAKCNNDWSFTTDFFLNLSSFTISLWVNRPNQNTNNCNIFGTNGNELQLRCGSDGSSSNRDSNGICLAYVVSGTEYIIRADNILDYGNWCHFVVIKDGINGYIYKNNVLVYSDNSGNSGIVDVPSDNILGILQYGSTGSTDLFIGSVDQIRIFNRALTDQEVQILYKEELQKYTIDISDLSLSQAPTKSYIILPRTEIALHSEENKANAENIELEVISDLSTTSELHCIPKNITILKDTKKNILLSRTQLEIEGNDVDINTASFIDTVNTLDALGDSSCVAFYPLDGNANDLSGNYNGTWSGTEQYDTGVFGQAAKFDGSSKISIGNPISVDGSFSVALWAPIGTSTNYKVLGRGNVQVSGNNYGYRINIFNDYIEFGRNVGSSTDNYIKYNFIISDDNFHLFCVTYDISTGKAKIFVDGNLCSSGVLSTNNIAYNSSYDSGNCEIANLGNGVTSSMWNKTIDQVRIFNRALTEQEVKQLYYAQRFKYTLTNALSSIPNYVYVRPDYHQIQQISNVTYDSNTGLYQVQYNKVDISSNTARAVQAKWRARKSGDENHALKIDLWRT